MDEYQVARVQLYSALANGVRGNAEWPVQLEFNYKSKNEKSKERHIYIFWKDAKIRVGNDTRYLTVFKDIITAQFSL